MKNIVCAFLFCLITTAVTAQGQSVAQLQETARDFMRQGDYANAVLVLKRAQEMEPQNIGVSKDLAMSYYYQKDNAHALEIIKPVLDNESADDQCFQIAGNIYKQLNLVKDCEKMYKKGIKKFPESGPLYNEYGELLWSEKDFDAIKQWEKGIESEPSYSRNYYNAAKFYFFTSDKVWSILYSEIFINMEPVGSKTPEMKQLLLDSYKKLFTDTDIEQASKDKNSFVKTYLRELNKEAGIMASGVNIESLTMIRTRFILDWFSGKENIPAFRLFEYHQQMLKEGMFEAYNQWLFGSVQDLQGYQNWVNTHAQDNKTFLDFQNGRIFKIPAGQYYH